MLNNTRAHSSRFIFISLSTLALLSLAFQHGSPYIYFDSRIYITNGMQMLANYKRSPIYGAFIYFTSFQFSLWFTLLAQALITVYVLLEVLHAFGIRQKERLLFYLCALLSFSSALSLYVSRIMPDFATPLVFCLLYVLIFKPHTFSRFKLILNTLFFIFLGSLHFSHVVMIPIATLILFFFWRQDNIPFKRFVSIFFLWVLFTAANPALNYALEGEFKLAKTKYAFLNARLLDHGILKPHVKKRCDEDPLISPYCMYSGKLPQQGDFFLHAAPNFDLEHLGGKFDTHGAHKWMFYDAMSDPKNIARFLLGSVVDSASQFFTINILQPTPKYWAADIRKQFFPLEYQKSHQNRQDENRINKLMSIAQAILIFTCLVLFGWAEEKKLFKKSETRFMVYLLLALIVNAVTLATLSNIVCRYQARVVWLFPFFVLVFLYKQILEPHDRLED